jgi:PIN like domain
LRDAFPGRYRPTQDDFERLWGEGLIVPDTDVLFGLYRRYYSKYRKELVNVLRGAEDQLWLGHQIAHKFLNGRLRVIGEMRMTYEKTFVTPPDTPALKLVATVVK